MWQDVTYVTTEKMPPYPGQPKTKFKKLCSIEEGASSNVTILNMSVHTGTHMDAPSHFIKDGADISEFSPKIGIGRGKVIQIYNDDVITVKEIQSFEMQYGRIKRGERIFFKTKNSEQDWGEEKFNHDYIYLSKEAAQYLVTRKINLVGIDYLSISKGEVNADVHQILLGNNCWIVEGLDLRKIEQGLYNIICLPVKFKDADGAPCRVLVHEM